jgi:hypothetical protein
MATQFDDFLRVDHTDLGANWTDLDPAWTILSNQAYAAGGTEQVAVWNSSVTDFTDDHFAEATVAGMAGSTYVGVVVQGKASSGFGDGYLFYSNNVESFIGKHVNGTRTNQQSGLAPFATNDVIKLTVESDVIRAYINGAQVGTDQAGDGLTGGQPGIFCYNAGGIIDDWTGEDISGGGGGGGVSFLTLLGVG